MGSRERLWQMYGEIWGWPRATMTFEADHRDLVRHALEMEALRARRTGLSRAHLTERAMNYEHHTVVTEPVELRPVIERLLSQPDVAIVHARTLAPQCFLYAVASD
jgi:hypothetical protein